MKGSDFSEAKSQPKYCTKYVYFDIITGGDAAAILPTNATTTNVTTTSTFQISQL